MVITKLYPRQSGLKLGGHPRPPPGYPLLLVKTRATHRVDWLVGIRVSAFGQEAASSRAGNLKRRFEARACPILACLREQESILQAENRLYSGSAVHAAVCSVSTPTFRLRVPVVLRGREPCSKGSKGSRVGVAQSHGNHSSMAHPQDNNQAGLVLMNLSRLLCFEVSPSRLKQPPPPNYARKIDKDICCLLIHTCVLEVVCTSDNTADSITKEPHIRSARSTGLPKATPSGPSATPRYNLVSATPTP